MMTIILFVLGFASIVICIGILIAVVTLVPLFIYTLPYNLSRPATDNCDESLFKMASDATKYYRTKFIKPTV